MLKKNVLINYKLAIYYLYIEVSYSQSVENIYKVSGRVTVQNVSS